MKPYPKWACAECGEKHGSKKANLKYQDEWFLGPCEVCGEESLVTDPKEYGHFVDWFKKQK
jgi:hypothetical protein